MRIFTNISRFLRALRIGSVSADDVTSWHQSNSYGEVLKRPCLLPTPVVAHRAVRFIYEDSRRWLAPNAQEYI